MTEAEGISSNNSDRQQHLRASVEWEGHPNLALDLMTCVHLSFLKDVHLCFHLRSTSSDPLPQFDLVCVAVKNVELEILKWG